ncbi:AAA family ATPase [Candidatus Sumerlaeota bacterium]|nr:AAA family ATPase [Candidatus Sumerlaeota bacterium]
MEANDPAAIVDMLDAEPTRGPSGQMQMSAQRAHDWFGFEDNPFRDSVNPKFFFRTDAHEEAYLKMRQCIEEDIAIGLTAAASGTGKTLLTQILLSDLNPRCYHPVVILVYPQMTRTALLTEIARELEIEVREGTRVQTLVANVHRRIIELYRRGVKPVLIIDEVHFLKSDSLHLLRTLSNIEVPERKLVTILLFGEEAFLDKLEQPRYRALLSRVFVRADLRPLTPGEVEQYVKFRCLVAGGNGAIFERDAFPLIYELSGGIPREINRLCYAAMTRAMARRRSSIGTDLLAVSRAATETAQSKSA